MKPKKNLTVGDWVLDKAVSDNPVQIEQINEQNVHYKRGNGYMSVGVELLEPVPLMPEILEKNGFIANTHVYPYPYYEYINEKDKLKVGFTFPKGNKTSYKEPWVYIDSEYAFVEHLPCIYVHQLQHALRLCRIEKEIIL